MMGKPEMFIPKVIEIDLEQDTDIYSKYLQTKNIVTAR